MKKSMLRMILVFIVSVSLILPGSVQRASAAGGTVYFIDINNMTGYIDPVTGQASKGLSMTDYYAIKVIQGVVNRSGPKFFVDQDLNYYKDCDDYWKTYYEGKGYTFITLNNMAEVYSTFKSYFNGVVTYNHTITTDTWHWPEGWVASTVGALTNRIPILSSRVNEFQTNYNLSPTTSLTLTDSFSDYYDAPTTINGRLETYGWTSTVQTFQWGYDNLLKYCNPHEFHSFATEVADLAAERKIFGTYLMSSVPEEFALLKNIYSYMGARNGAFPVWGWVKQEDVDLDAMAPYGGYITMAGSTNLSFHNKMASSLQNFIHSMHYTPANTTLDNNKYYITFFASENDTPKAVTTLQHGSWLDPNRGSVPINWGFEASMANETPGMAEYYYNSATANDYFFSGGATPLGFADYDEFPQDAKNDVKTKGAALMQKVDQKYLDLYSSYGAIGTLDANAYGDLAAALGLDGLTADLGFDGTQNWPNSTFTFSRTNMYPLRQTDFSDDFGSGTGKWTAESGTWAIESGEYSQGDTSSTQRSAYATNSTHAYVNASVQVKKVSGTSGSAGMTFRKGTGANYYWFYIKDGNKAGLMKVVNGTKTVLGSEVDFSHSANTAYKLKVVANGTLIKCYIDGKLVLSITDSTFASGKLGLATVGNHAHFDNMKVVWTTQVQQIMNYIKSKTVDVSKAKPFFMSGYYGYMFTNDFEKCQEGSEPGAGETMIANPTILKQVQDSLNSLYPGQFKFARLDEFMSAQKIYLDTNTGMHDDLTDFSKMYSHSANLQFDSSGPANFMNDTSRLYRSSNTQESIVYKTPSLTDKDITSFSMDTWFWPDETPVDFEVYTSPDNAAYTKYSPQKVTTEPTGTVWRKITYSGSALPAGTKYIKFVFKHMTSNYWNPQIGSIDVYCTPSSGTITDAVNDWSKIYAHSSNLQFDASSPANFGGDVSRLYRSSNTEEFVTYRAPGASKVSSFVFDAWYWPDETPVDFAVYTSPDNAVYTQFVPQKTTVAPTGTVWIKNTYTGNGLPAGTKYIKIVWKHMTANYWNPQLGGVSYGYN